MTEQEVIEVVARAILQTCGEPWETQATETKRALRNEGKAALTALKAHGFKVMEKRPTAGMLNCGVDCGRGLHPSAVWQRMFDAAPNWPGETKP